MTVQRPASGPDPDESNLRLGVVALVVLLGVGILAHPLYLWPHYNQTPYSPGNVQQVPGDSLDQSTVIEYENAPRAAQESFDAARNGEYVPLWSGEEDQAITVLQNHRYVQYQGAYYEYDVVHADIPRLYTGLSRGLLTALGVFLVTWGLLAGYAQTWKPLSPVRTLLFVAVATVALVATQTYDVVYSGAAGQLPVPTSFLSLIPIGMGFLGVGSVAQRRGRRSLLPVAGISVVTLVLGAVVFSAPPVVPLIFGIMLIVAGTPWMMLGYALTTDTEPR